MPTGYTAAIEKGITFEQYALDCARAFGALVHMRDEPHGTPIPDEIQPGTYNLNAFTKASTELGELDRLTMGEAEARAKEAFTAQVKDLTERIRAKQELRRKYEDMLAKAEAYVSPSPDHDNFKAFMCSQIRESIEFDCSDYYEKELRGAVLKTGKEWLDSERERVEWSRNYHWEAHQKKLERVRKVNEWVRLLRESLRETTK